MTDQPPENTEQPQPQNQAQFGAGPPPPPQPGPSTFQQAAPVSHQAPFGGAAVPPMAPPVQKRSRIGMFTCLVAFCFIGAFFALIILGAISSISELDVNALSGMSSFKAGGDTIALINIEGPIYDSKETLSIIKHYADNDKIKAYLVRINSPGGAVGASQEIYQALLDLREDGKTVVASMGNVAASGGYYIAAAADEIVTNSGTLTGSIGVIMSFPNFEGINEKLGMKFEVVKSGKFKDVPSATRTMTEQERAFLQSVILDTYDQFVEAVFSNRSEQLTVALGNLSDETPFITPGIIGAQDPEKFLRDIADGRVLTGRQAVQMGLADYLGSIQFAKKRIEELTGISDMEIYEYKPKKTLSEILSAKTNAVIEKSALGRWNGVRLEYRMQF